MPPPSQLSIATSAVNRLLKEETTYKRELAGQHERLKKMESETGGDEDGNREFLLKQERKSIEETEAVFGPLHDRIRDSVQKLQSSLAENESSSGADEVKAAKEALAQGEKI